MTTTMKLHKIALIGCGVSGTILLLKLLESVQPEDICVIDPAFDGGDLARHWSEVNSNTTWGQFLDATDKLILAKSVVDKKRTKYDPNSITPVYELSKTLNQALSLHLHKVDANTCYAKTADFDTKTGIWTIKMESPGCLGIRYANTVLYAPGGVPKQVNLSKPQIPLEVVLDSSRLARAVEPGMHILLFGLAHSGILALKNLLALGTQVSAIYQTNTPFVFARDGAYKGIKQDAAIFADELLANPSNFVTFIKSKDAENTIRAYNKCDAIVSAIGFNKNTNTCAFSVDAVHIGVSEYDSQTGSIKNATRLFGFGIAYASTSIYEGNIYEDAGVPSFVDHAIKIVPGILGVEPVQTTEENSIT